MECIKDNSSLSIVSAYFTIYAFEKLKDQLQRIDHLNFLFGEPRFVKNLDPDRTDKKAFRIEDEKLALSNRLQQKYLAKECTDWIETKVDIKSVKQANLLHGKMYHIDDDGRKKALVGSSNFTVSGLGYGANPNIELNLEVADDRDRDELKLWFDEIWNNDELVQDVKQEVLRYLAQLYADHSPQFIYYLTLFNLFRDYLDGTRDIDESLRRAALPDTISGRSCFLSRRTAPKQPLTRFSSVMAVSLRIVSVSARHLPLWQLSSSLS